MLDLPRNHSHYWMSLQDETFIYVINLVTLVTNMITLLKPGYGKIMQLFYADKSAKLHLREIARQARLHTPSATRFLKSLEKEHILRSSKDGNLKKYSIRRTLGAYLLFEIFDIQRFDRLPSIRKNAIRAYLDNLPQRPVFAILFGSSAKGTFTDESDIDILIIANTRMDAHEAEKEADALTAMKISTFQMTYEGFLTELKMNEDKVVQSAIASGYPLINHIQYYEVILHERV